MLLSLFSFFHNLIAIMLGRLNMSVDECIKVYEELMRSIFGLKAHRLPISASANIKAQYDSKRVKTAIEKVLREHDLPEDSLLNDGTECRCRVYVPIVMPLNNTDPSSRFVCCVAKVTKNAALIRSYNQNLHDNIRATICQAALATAAATSYFEPFAIGSNQYVDGALRNNNPVTQVEVEAQHLWCSDQVELKSLVKCFLSIGTGTPAKEALSYNPYKLIHNLISLATDTEAVHKSFQERWRRQLNEKRLFRFNVAQGLQNVDLSDYKKQDIITKATDEYMDERDQQVKLQACAENLMEKECTYDKIFSPNLSSGS